MFDNLPFFPSIEVLAAVQAHYRFHSELDPIESLAGRVENPDLLIAAALDASPDSATATGFDTQRKIWARANRLKKNLKIDSFDWASSKVHELMKDLSEQPPESKSDNDEDFVPVIDKAVSAGVLSIEPLDDEHINPTFAFSKTTGFKRERMARAIAHGCFQTFRKLASAQNGEDGLTQAARASVRILSDKTSGRIFRLEVADERDRESSGENKCPFFRHDDGGSKKTTEFVCPFVAAGKTREGEDADLIVGVHRACCADSTHLDLSR